MRSAVLIGAGLFGAVAAGDASVAATRLSSNRRRLSGPLAPTTGHAPDAPTGKNSYDTLTAAKIGLKFQQPISLIESLLPPPPSDLDVAMQDAHATRFVFLGRMVGSGDSNVMLALASGVALAIVTNRTPLVHWEGTFRDDRFGASPPRGLLDWSEVMPTASNNRCRLALTHFIAHRPCWASLLGTSPAAGSSINGSNDDLTRFMPGCKVVNVESNQYYLPLLLRFRVPRDGRTLRQALGGGGHAPPLAVMMQHLFVPPPLLTTAVDAFYSSLDLPLVAETRGRAVASANVTSVLARAPRGGSSAPLQRARPVRLLTVHLRKEIINLKSRKLGPDGIRGGKPIRHISDAAFNAFLNCSAAWARLSNATHVYIAGDSTGVLEAMASFFNRKLNARDSRVTIVSSKDLRAFHDRSAASGSNSTARSNPISHDPRDAAGNVALPASSAGGGWPSSLDDLVDSLMLGKGQVCLGTPGSTFSKLASNWWGASHCELLVEAGNECAVVGGRPAAAAQRCGDSSSSRDSSSFGSSSFFCAPLGPQPSPDAEWGESAFSGHVAHDVFGCNGRGCPAPTQARLAEVRSQCAPLRPLLDNFTSAAERRQLKPKHAPARGNVCCALDATFVFPLPPPPPPYIVEDSDQLLVEAAAVIKVVAEKQKVTVVQNLTRPEQKDKVKDGGKPWNWNSMSHTQRARWIKTGKG